MKEFKKQVIKLFGENFKKGDRFEALVSDPIYDEDENYIRGNIYELKMIDCIDIKQPLNFMCVTTGKYFWITFNEIFNFEKIGE